MWKLRNFTATIFRKKFRESNFLLKNFAQNWFDGKNVHGIEFLVFTHCEVATHIDEIIESPESQCVILNMETCKIHSHRKKFRQINYLVIFIKTVTFTKFLLKKCEIKFPYFPHSARQNVKMLWFSLKQYTFGKNFVKVTFLLKKLLNC